MYQEPSLVHPRIGSANPINPINYTKPAKPINPTNHTKLGFLAGQTKHSPSYSWLAANNATQAKPAGPKRPNDEPDFGNNEAATGADFSDEPSTAGSCLNGINSNRLDPDLSGQNNKKKIPKKVSQAMNLPTIMNVNPRSIYNKIQDFHTFVEVERIDCIFMSESWEPNQPLEEIINLPDQTIISNPHQRKGQGGRPALIINHKKYRIRNITQSLILIPWGIEAVWVILTPKEVPKESNIQKIALCTFYSKPDSRLKLIPL